jgi:hypothetical protein
MSAVPKGDAVKCNLKELAKFGAGVAAWESVVHLSFAASGVLPLKLAGVTITARTNGVQIVAAALASASLAYYGWCYEGAGAEDGAPSS